MARGTLASIESAGIAGGMPGPVSRGNIESVAKHLAALAVLGVDTLGLYRQLCERTVPLAVERGAIDAALAAQFLEVLKCAGRGCTVAAPTSRTAPCRRRKPGLPQLKLLSAGALTIVRRHGKLIGNTA